MIQIAGRRLQEGKVLVISGVVGGFEGVGSGVVCFLYTRPALNWRSQECKF